MATKTRPLVRLRRQLNLPGLLFILAVAFVWEHAVSTGLLSYEFLPAPSSILSATTDLTVSGQLPRDVLHTLVSCLVGWSVGSALGLLLGVWLGLSQPSWRYTMASVEVLRALPAISFVPVVVLLLGFSPRTEYVITTYVVLWPVLVNTIEGVRSVSTGHIEVARMLRMPAVERIRKIILPSAAPTVIVGLRLGLALALALAIVAEMVGNPEGVGYSLILQQQGLQPAAMFSYVMSIGLLGLLLNSGFLALARLVSPGTAALLEMESR